MSLIAVSHRVDITGLDEERRNCLDQRWVDYLLECDLTPLPIYNHIGAAKKLLQVCPVSGILLTGGNSLVEYGGSAPERDETEKFLIDFAINKQIPLLGVCRGMQMIQHYFGIKLEKIEGHVRRDHNIVINQTTVKVNSYHNFGTKSENGALITSAKSMDGTIEAVRHPDFSIEGIMWHPERNSPFKEFDKTIFKNLFRPNLNRLP
ncbi:MAG: C26 family cysteine hydrolase domain-containing family [Nitrospina sp.]|jgi:N5-(cytidine 5'-diphosphoramidyl)-L-glutamine hydrolase|nr:C26 family cysteine hydrolase domain-containing family [Nitrospina sp.]MBT3510499.1 C26 family cysteine hydrolase domain-containing family [Nitrospina sp.]MBT3875740.1 C26 family cysteine hydrolase domain-containing family [Nitrospina sp.]MBT4049187.1 C26 family cysteine hydrolase domain-containing family [Nitrospina sp.]MBT4557156.1 C26 family cysteine hydrolase domain-containing family [Nitrospina sp.]